jgi:Na+/proline symporter
VVAAILAAAMANLSAALNSLASTTIVDFVRARRTLSDSQATRLARYATIFWGVVLLGIGIAARHSKSVLEVGLTIASIPFGALLGVFLLGILTSRPRELAAIVGTVAGLATVLAVHFYTPIAWTWYVLIGTCTTFTVGILVSLLQGEPDTEPRA